MYYGRIFENLHISVLEVMKLYNIYIILVLIKSFYFV